MYTLCAPKKYVGKGVSGKILAIYQGHTDSQFTS